MGSIEIKHEKGHSPIAYYVERVKGPDRKFKKKKRYIGIVPEWYVPLFTREFMEMAKEKIK